MVSILLPSPCMVWKSDRGEERKDGSSRVAGGTRTLAKMGGGRLREAIGRAVREGWLANNNL